MDLLLFLVGVGVGVGLARGGLLGRGLDRSSGNGDNVSWIWGWIGLDGGGRGR